MAQRNYDAMRLVAKTITLPKEVFKELMDRTAVEFRAAFEQDYAYPREEGPAIIRRNGRPIVVRGITGTLRQNGDHLSDEGNLPYRPRDIMDLGSLRDSQERIDTAYTTLFRWTGDGEKNYALFVHDGYTPKLFGNRGDRVPGRPWTLKTLLRMREVVASIQRQRLRRG